MKCGLVTAIGGVAIVVAGLAGCSSNRSSMPLSSPEPVTPTSTAAPTSPSSASSPNAVASRANLVIDGKNQNLPGPVTCGNKDYRNSGVNTVFTYLSGRDSGLNVVLAGANDPPQVVSTLMLGNFEGLSWSDDHSEQAHAAVTKDGNTYTITGTAAGAAPAKSQLTVYKPFELTVTCP